MPTPNSSPNPKPDATTDLILIRHGETAWNRELRFQGHADVPLNDIGHEQARRLGLRLAGETVQHILSSDLMRAQQTAAPAAQAGAHQRVEVQLFEQVALRMAAADLQQARQGLAQALDGRRVVAARMGQQPARGRHAHALPRGARRRPARSARRPRCCAAARRLSARPARARP
jgi:hypothetical protein